jgi:hypothetical protein
MRAGYVAFGLSLYACGWGLAACGDARQLAMELLARKAECALANRHLPNEQLILKCALDPKDIPDILRMVGRERENDAKMARAGCSSADAGAE